MSTPNTPRYEENAAVALAQLQQDHSEWESDMVGLHWVASDADNQDTEPFQEMELPPLRPQNNRPRELLPSILAHSPPGRYSSLPPIQRSGKLQRPRKSSVGQNARKPKHERTKSREYRLSLDGRKAMSAEPPTAAWVQGKRWEDLIEAAASATEADDGDQTPVRASTVPKSVLILQVPSSPRPIYKQSSVPPGIRTGRQWHASPLQNALTPPPPDPANEPFPSVESHDSGHGFHMPASGLSSSANDTSPLHPHHSQSSSLGSRSDMLEVYCARCRRPALLKACYACGECICAVCAECVGQRCPRCSGAKWKRFQLDFR